MWAEVVADLSCKVGGVEAQSVCEEPSDQTSDDKEVCTLSEHRIARAVCLSPSPFPTSSSTNKHETGTQGKVRQGTQASSFKMLLVRICVRARWQDETSEKDRPSNKEWHRSRCRSPQAGVRGWQCRWCTRGRWSRRCRSSGMSRSWRRRRGQWGVAPQPSRARPRWSAEKLACRLVLDTNITIELVTKEQIQLLNTIM